jgi:hypothetical protein
LPIDDEAVFPSGKHPKRTLRKEYKKNKQKNRMK